MEGGDAGDAGVVYGLLAELGVLAGLGVGLALGDQTVEKEPARCAVDGDLGAVGEAVGVEVGVALGERLLEAVEQVELVDVLLMAERHEGLHHLVVLLVVVGGGHLRHPFLLWVAGKTGVGSGEPAP